MRSVKLIFLLIFSCSSILSYAQPPSQTKNDALLENYNFFLNRSGYDQLLTAKEQSQELSANYPQYFSQKDLKIKVLILQSNSKFYSVTDFIKALNRFSNKDSGDFLFKNLFLKFCDYQDGQLENKLVIIRFRNREDLKVVLYFDKELKLFSSLPDVKGIEGGEDFGNPDASAYGGIIFSVNSKDLNNKLRNGLNHYFQGLPGLKPISVDFKPLINENMIRVAVRRLKGSVTPGYHEVLFLYIYTLPSKKGGVDICFNFTVLYAQGVMMPSRTEDFRDCSKSYYRQVSFFGQKLKEQIRNIVNK